MAAYLSAELLLKYFLLLNTVVVITFNTIAVVEVEGATTTWCVARSDATAQALQTALDYACASGADCTPLQSDGLCFLPNTIQAHASYAFNSYYQRKSMAPGSCDFSGTATIAQTDPSYGSCMYPSSLRKCFFFLFLGFDLHGYCKNRYASQKPFASLTCFILIREKYSGCSARVILHGGCGNWYYPA
ncbi:hypothetical protein FNV43_RR02354 [Rhamnella rubrinervis]|uniref:X8 domain-containing protein n=1 Tax=Rhamnella rubrinervis TaxID=2594499 RepID=A0A8K0HRB8_9ROSA|nr:hypothetical protein FNV43_RR02354 [Rhamnella rubrinervis]